MWHRRENTTGTMWKMLGFSYLFYFVFSRQPEDIVELFTGIKKKKTHTHTHTLPLSIPRPIHCSDSKILGQIHWLFHSFFIIILLSSPIDYWIVMSPKLLTTKCNQSYITLRRLLISYSKIKDLKLTELSPWTQRQICINLLGLSVTGKSTIAKVYFSLFFSQYLCIFMHYNDINTEDLYVKIIANSGKSWEKVDKRKLYSAFKEVTAV